MTFAQLAEFVWFAETGTGYTGAADGPLLGTHEGRCRFVVVTDKRWEMIEEQLIG